MNLQHQCKDYVNSDEDRLKQNCGMAKALVLGLYFLSSRRRHTRLSCDWSSDVYSSDLSTLLNSRRRHTRLSCDWSSDVCSHRARPLDAAVEAAPAGEPLLRERQRP